MPVVELELVGLKLAGLELAGSLQQLPVLLVVLVVVPVAAVLEQVIVAGQRLLRRK